MTLFTDEQYKQLLSNGAPENRDRNHKPVVHLCIPGTACEWLLSEIDPEEPDIAFGLCDIGFGFPELGYVSLGEIKSVRAPLWGTTVYANPLFTGKYPMSVYANAARECECITRNEELLQKHFQAYLKQQYNP